MRRKPKAEPIYLDQDCHVLPKAGADDPQVAFVALPSANVPPIVMAGAIINRHVLFALAWHRWKQRPVSL